MFLRTGEIIVEGPRDSASGGVYEQKEGMMNFAKRVFQVAGLYGIVVTVPSYFLEERMGRDSPPAITHAEYFYGFLGVVLAWQIAYLVIATDPVRFRTMMLVGAAGKFSFTIATAVLLLQQRIAGPVLILAAADLLFVGLFIAAYARSLPTAAAGKS